MPAETLSQDKGSYVVADLSQVPMTDAMQASNELAQVARMLQDMADAVRELNLDAMQAAFAENQKTLDVIKTQSRPITWRASLYRIFKADRDIDIPRRHWREKANEGLKPEPLPSYLNLNELTRLRKRLAALSLKVNKILAERDEQYPDFLARTRSLIHGETRRSA
ncbi:hypothetical protein [Streptomyces griseoaurantiacus]|uniref:hypothetical protein n=1 Tax=Streptomyces griseoaurantiacus TaxID=68213 RepID=UPI0036A4582A